MSENMNAISSLSKISVLLYLIVLLSCERTSLREDPTKQNNTAPPIGMLVRDTVCNTGPRKTLDTLFFKPGVAYIHNVDRKYYVRNDQHDSLVCLMISNQQDYEKYVAIVADQTRPTIDFSKYDLFGCKLTIFKCGGSKSTNIAPGCEVYVFTATIWKGDCDSGAILHHFIIAEKPDLPVRFQIKYDTIK